MRNEPTWIEIRDARLRSDYQRMLNLTRDNGLITIEKTDGDPPEIYGLRFNCRGVIGVERSKPLFAEVHRVRITLPVEYPTRPPQMRWLTPIFHPNINAEGTYVCVDTWYPSKFLDDLSIMLGRMIQYKNYNPFNPLRSDAASWAKENERLFPLDDRSLRPGDVCAPQAGDLDIRIL